MKQVKTNLSKELEKEWEAWIKAQDKKEVKKTLKTVDKYPDVEKAIFDAYDDFCSKK